MHRFQSQSFQLTDGLKLYVVLEYRSGPDVHTFEFVNMRFSVIWSRFWDASEGEMDRMGVSDEGR